MRLVEFLSGSRSGTPIKVNADAVGSLYPHEYGGTIISSVNGAVIAYVAEDIEEVARRLAAETKAS